MHLDSIFCDVNLDSFNPFSSASCLIGNVGQANYSVANMGVVRTAARRKKRGRRSVANVGVIIDIGYIIESAHQLELTVANQHLTHLNDDQFH